MLYFLHSSLNLFSITVQYSLLLQIEIILSACGSPTNSEIPFLNLSKFPHRKFNASPITKSTLLAISSNTSSSLVNSGIIGPIKAYVFMPERFNSLNVITLLSRLEAFGSITLEILLSEKAQLTPTSQLGNFIRISISLITKSDFVNIETGT